MFSQCNTTAMSKPKPGLAHLTKPKLNLDLAWSYLIPELSLTPLLLPALCILGVVVHYLCDCRDWPCLTRPSCTLAFSSIGEGNRKNYKSLRTTDSSSATPCKHWLLRANATSTPQRPPQTHADDATEKIRFWTDILCATLLWALETRAKPRLKLLNLIWDNNSHLVIHYFAFI